MSEMELFTLPSVLVGVTARVPPAAFTPMYSADERLYQPPEFEEVTEYQVYELKAVGVPVITQAELIDNPVGRVGEILHDVGMPPTTIALSMGTTGLIVTFCVKERMSAPPPDT